MRKKQPAIMPALMRSPAIAGPPKRARLKAAECTAIPLVMSLLPTRSNTRDCLAGTSNAIPAPKTEARSSTIGNEIRLLPTKRPNRTACMNSAKWISIRKEILGSLSARTPPSTARRSMGSPVTMPSRPT